MRAWGSYLGEQDVYDDREEAYQSMLDAIDDDSDDDGSDDERLLKRQMNPISLYQIATSIYNDDQCIVTIPQKDTTVLHINNLNPETDHNTNIEEGCSSMSFTSTNSDAVNINHTIIESELELPPIPSLTVQQSITEPTDDIFADIELNVQDDMYTDIVLDPILIEEINDIINTCHNSNDYGYNNYSNNNQNNTHKNNNSQKQNTNNNNNNNDNNHNGSNNNNGNSMGGSGNGGDKKRNSDDDKDKKREKDKTKIDKNKNNKCKQNDNDEENEDKQDEKEEKRLDVNAQEFIPNQTVSKLEPIDEKLPLQSCLSKKSHKSRKKQSITSDSSYDPIPLLRAKGNIKISRAFTNENGKISKMIRENIKNLYFYIDKHTALQNNKEIKLKNGKIIKIMNYDFHHRETNENLYCILEKCDKKDAFKWEMYGELLNKSEIEQKCEISTDKLPQGFRMTAQFQKHLNQKENIMNMMMNRQKMKEVISKTKWTKIPIKNRYHSKKRITLSLNREEFIKNLQCLNIYNSKNDIHLIPILMFNNLNDTVNKYWIEYLWITKIDKDTNIAISLKYNEKTNSISVNGIHLDKTYILHQTQLVSPLNSADFLDDIFISNITDLSIGNPDDNKNAINALKQRCQILKQEKVELKITCDDVNEENINLKKEMERMKNEYEKMKQFMSNISISNTTPTSISAEIMDPITPNSLSLSSPIINLQQSTNFDAMSYQQMQPQFFNNDVSNVLPGLYSIGHNLVLLKHQ